MNKLDDNIWVGAVGELFVQLRLLDHGVQAAPPLKDTGNDLIAVKEDVFKAIQVKTRSGDAFSWKADELPQKFHILALVRLYFDGEDMLLLDQCKIYLLREDQVDKRSYQLAELEGRGFSMTAGKVLELFV
jgi:hypothetical protein